MQVKIKLKNKDTEQLIKSMAEALAAQKMAAFFNAILTKEDKARSEGQPKLSDAVYNGFKDAIKTANDDRQREEGKALEAYKQEVLREFAKDAEAINPDVIATGYANNLKAELNDAGEVVLEAVNPTTGSPTLSTTTGRPMTAGELIAKLKSDKETAYLFGEGQAQVKGVMNPWRRETFNLTQQGKILTENPTLAAQMKAEAGK
jgi:hypothetical protein